MFPSSVAGPNKSWSPVCRLEPQICCSMTAVYLRPRLCLLFLIGAHRDAPPSCRSAASASAGHGCSVAAWITRLLTWCCMLGKNAIGVLKSEAVNHRRNFAPDQDRFTQSENGGVSNFWFLTCWRSTMCAVTVVTSKHHLLVWGRRVHTDFSAPFSSHFSEDIFKEN